MGHIEIPADAPPGAHEASGDGAGPLFPSVAIVGLGLIGGSIALAARRRWPGTRVVAVDRAEQLDDRRPFPGVDDLSSDLAIVSGASLVVLCAPVRQNEALLERVGAVAAADAVITDAGSTKRGIVGRSAHLASPAVFVGGHPLGGATDSGPAHARADLFDGRPWIFTPTTLTPPSTVDRLCAFVRGLGARPHVMTPEAHDAAMAALSHLPQLVASALMDAVGEAVPHDTLGLAGRGLADTTRLAESRAEIWRDITASNADVIAPALDALIAKLQALRADLGHGETLTEVFERAARVRRQLATKQAAPGA